MQRELGAVRHAEHDRLDRQRFAAGLAHFIANLRAGDEGYVIGLEGPWGSGKSSIIHMVREELLHLEMVKRSALPVFHGDTGSELEMHRLRSLAPKHFATAYDPLTVDLQYFTQDVVNRRHAQQAAEDQKFGVDLYRYFRMCRTIPDNGRVIFTTFEPWLIPESSELASVFIRELARSIGARLGPEVEASFAQYSQAVSELAPIAGAAVDSLYPGAGAAFNVLTQWFQSGHALPATLEERRADLERALQRLRGRKVVIAIDDLDRLTPREASEMVGLVKGLGRLPNIIYLLSYDVENLEKLIRLGTRLDGRAYLEKIVQYKRSTPPASKQALTSLFNECLNGIAPDIVSPASDRLGEVWRAIVLPALKTPRDAIRLGNMFRAGWDAVGVHLDASDFLLLQLTHLADPVLHTFIRENLRALCGLDLSLLGNELKHLVESQQFDTKEAASILEWLFPAVARVMSRHNPGSSQNARIDRRLQVFDNRQAYLELIVPDDAISSLEVQELLTSPDPARKLTEMLARADSSDRPDEIRAQFLDDLRQHYGDGTPIPIPIPMALALVKAAPSLLGTDDPRAANLLDDTNSTRIQSIIIRGLLATPPDERASLLLTLIREADDLSIVASICRTALGPSARPIKSTVDLEMAGREDEVIRALLNKFRANKTVSWVFDQTIPSAILWFWRDHAGDAEVVAFLKKAVRSRRYFPELVNFLVSGVRSTGRPSYWEYVPDWAKEFVDLEVLDAKAKRHLSSDDPATVEAARRYIKARETPEHGPADRRS
ncbi:hypothetical protein VW29_18220 [Devosia limi DSM 17137]|uniref:KAP family P-loop domain-containing protein n=1 Tax=Devosia limi DSM 17137 TaxID=1121477 RepID=A0A0F5L4M0_9HYPH|nr:P-loop NTPase fold protein [Devosia limi]KKB77303.1 hypothetical protein VW29_18220 [Devosia limi DSM 17137]SHE65379.1 KAP family P-loop domain-containing protein [Devosia limi DSM 17137]